MKKQTVESKEQMAMTVADIARRTVDKQILQAMLDERLLAARDELQPKIDALGKAIKADLAAAKSWAVKHKAEFGAARSMDFGLGIAGFRLGMPKLSLLKGWTVERVIDAVKARLPRKGYIRTIEELDKAALIADRDNLDEKTRDAIGIEIEQSEAFFVDLKLDEAARVAEERK